MVFFFKQKTAYEMRISDWSSDVCSSDLPNGVGDAEVAALVFHRHHAAGERRRLEEVVEAEEVGEAEIILGGPVAIRIEGDGGVALVGGRPVVEDEIGRASCRERVCQYV